MPSVFLLRVLEEMLLAPLTFTMLGASSCQHHGSPGARAVHGFVPFVSSQYPRSLALLYHGQRSQSSPGDVDAGEFWDDIWLPETGAKGEPELVWRYVELPRD